jgi:serine/threonine-protein kinase RsbW
MTEGSDLTDQGEFDGVELSMPATPELLHLARMTAGVVAARADLELDDVEDLRLAVDELCLPFLSPEAGTGRRLVLRYGWDGPTIEISCMVTGGLQKVRTDDPVRDELSTQILDALVDAHGVLTSDGQSGAWLRMRRGRPPGR